MKAMLCLLLGIFFGMAGRAHFTRPDVYVAIMPDWIPAAWHKFLVDLTGVLEILGGVFLIFPATRVNAAWFLIALLVAIFPANIHMAVHNLPFGDYHPPRWFHLVRLPLQFVLIALVAYAGGLFAKTAR
jgi:uncharacterized membrane protein